MAVPRQKWIAGWPVGSWGGFLGALCAVVLAARLWQSSSRVDWTSLGVAAICVTLAFANLRIAKRP